MLAVVFKCSTFDDVTKRGRHVPTTTGVGVGGREGGMGGREGCDGNYQVGAYGMEWVHNREPERNQLVTYTIMFNKLTLENKYNMDYVFSSAH